MKNYTRLVRLLNLAACLILAACQNTKPDDIPARECQPVTVTEKRPIVCECGKPDRFYARPTPPVVIWGKPHKSDKPESLWWGWTDQANENMAANLQDIKKHGEQSRIVEQCYRTCIEQHNKEAVTE